MAILEYFAVLFLSLLVICLVNLLIWMWRERRDFGWGNNRPVDQFRIKYWPDTWAKKKSHNKKRHD
jgi:hypothetical protein